MRLNAIDGSPTTSARLMRYSVGPTRHCTGPARPSNWAFHRSTSTITYGFATFVTSSSRIRPGLKHFSHPTIYLKADHGRLFYDYPEGATNLRDLHYQTTKNF